MASRTSNWTPSVNRLSSDYWDQNYPGHDAPPQFKDTQQGKDYAKTFGEADPQTKQTILTHLQAGAKGGNQKSAAQLDAVSHNGQVDMNTANPVKTAPASILGHNFSPLVQGASDVATEQIAKPIIRGGDTLTKLQQNQFQGAHNKVNPAQFASDAITTGLNAIPVGEGLEAGAGLITKLVKGAKTGAVVGGIQGVSSEAPKSLKPTDLLKRGVEGSIAGAALGAGATGGADLAREAAGMVKSAVSPLKNATKTNLVKTATGRVPAPTESAKLPETTSATPPEPASATPPLPPPKAAPKPTVTDVKPPQATTAPSSMSHIVHADNLDSAVEHGIHPTTDASGSSNTLLGHDYKTPEGETKNAALDTADTSQDNAKINFKTSAIKGGMATHGPVATTVHEPIPVTPDTVHSIEVPTSEQATRLADQGFKAEVNPSLKATPETPAEPAPTQTPVEPKPEPVGETKTSGVASAVEKRAIENKLTNGFQDLPEYESINMKDQASQAADLVKADPEKAIRIATAKETPPSGLKALSVHQALEHHATERGDSELLHQLAKSPLTVKTSEGAQDLRILAERDPESAVGAIKRVVDARVEAVKAKLGKTPDSAVKDEATAIKASVPKVTRQDWNSFIESIRC